MLINNISMLVAYQVSNNIVLNGNFLKRILLGHVLHMVCFTRLFQGQ
jgi:hypothetical protein